MRVCSCWSGVEVTSVSVLVQYPVLMHCTNTLCSEASDAWLRMSEISATMVILGLHQERKADDQVPFFICELRIRLFEQVYAHDKVPTTETLHLVESAY
jgi:hypothetical protein